MRRGLGVIFQDYRLLPDKTVYENVAFAMEVIEAPRRLMQRSVNAVLDIVGLREKWKNFPWQLSGGEQQRLSLARALLHRPDILFLDEATNQLDDASAAELMRTLRQALPDALCIGISHQTRIQELFDRRVDLAEFATREENGL